MARCKAKRRRVETAAAGARVRLRTNQSWGGLQVPAGTLGTLYDTGKRWMAVAFDGYDRLQPNGYPFGVRAFGCPRSACDGCRPESIMLPDFLELA